MCYRRQETEIEEGRRRWCGAYTKDPGTPAPKASADQHAVEGQEALVRFEVRRLREGRAPALGASAEPSPHFGMPSEGKKRWCNGRAKAGHLDADNISNATQRSVRRVQKLTGTSLNGLKVARVTWSSAGGDGHKC